MSILYDEFVKIFFETRQNPPCETKSDGLTQRKQLIKRHIEPLFAKKPLIACRSVILFSQFGVSETFFSLRFVFSNLLTCLIE